MADKKYTPVEAAIIVLNKAKELYSASSLSKSEDLKKGEWNKIHAKLKKEGYSEKSADKIDGAIKAKMGKSEELDKAEKFDLKHPTQKDVTIHSSRSPGLASGRSEQGKAVREGNKLEARHAAKDRIADSKGVKPNLIKDEDMNAGSAMSMSEEDPDEKADAELGEEVERAVESHEENNEDPKHEMKGHIKLAKFMGRMEHKKGQKAKELEKGETGHEKGVHLSTTKDLQNVNKDKGISQSGAILADQNAGAAKTHHKQVLDQIHQMTKPKLPG